MNKRTLLIALLALLPAITTASNWNIQLLADELVYASNELARSAKAVRGFSSVGHNASRLSTKSEQFADSISRGRSSAHVRTRFTDVSRYYERVESAFLSARRIYGTDYVDQSFDYVASLYEDLRFEFYGDVSYQGFRSNSQSYQAAPYTYYNAIPYYTTPRKLKNPPRKYGQRNPRPPVTQRHNGRRDNYDHQSPVIARQNQRDRNDNRNNPNNRNNDRNNQRRDDDARASRRDNSANQERNSNNNTANTRRDSPVVQRQNQRDNDRNYNSNSNTRNAQSRNSALSDQPRESSVTQRQSQRRDGGSGRVGVNNLQNRSNSTATTRINRLNTNNRAIRQRR